MFKIKKKKSTESQMHISYKSYSKIKLFYLNWL